MDINDYREHLKKIVESADSADVKADRLVAASMRLCAVELGGGARSLAERFPRGDKKLRRLIEALELRAREWAKGAAAVAGAAAARAEQKPQLVVPA